MSMTRWDAHCTPEDVFSVLSDGWLYAMWVVGASRIRAVDATWPAAGAKIHHSVGVWPVLIDDSTSVLEVDPPRRLVLQARAWPTGEAKVELTIEPTSTGCRMTIREDVATGPATKIPSAVRQPLLDARNRESLRRLAMLAEGRAR